MQPETDHTARAAELLQKLREAIGQAVVGQTAVIDQVLIALSRQRWEQFATTWTTEDIRVQANGAAR